MVAVGVSPARAGQRKYGRRPHPALGPSRRVPRCRCISVRRSKGRRDYRAGWRLGLARSGRVGLGLNLEAPRREAANDDAPEHGA